MRDSRPRPVSPGRLALAWAVAESEPTSNFHCYWGEVKIKDGIAKTFGPMIEIGKTDVRLGKLSFGGAALGNLFSAVPKTQAAQAIRAALDMGFRHFDTAPRYGSGLSEIRLGDVLAERPYADVTVSTKIGYMLGADLERDAESVFVGDLPNVGGAFDYSCDGVLRSLEGSLERLALSRVDIVLLHDLDPTIHRDADVFERHRDVALREGWPALRELRQNGTVRAIGFGLNHAGTAERLLEETDPDIILLAGRYTLIEHSDALPFLAACAERNVAVMIGGPFNSGILATGSSGAAMYDYALADRTVLERVRRIEDACRSHGASLAAAALQFSFGHPAVITVLPGMRSADEVKRNSCLMAEPIPTSLWDALREQELISWDVPTP